MPSHDRIVTRNMEPRAAARNSESEDKRETIAQTLIFWQPRVSKRLNAEDARQMIENIAGLFSQVDVWDRNNSAEADIRPGNAEVTEIRVSNGPASKNFTQEHTSCNQVPDLFAA
jgi:hypothetical protein